MVAEGRADPVVEEGRADPVVEEGRADPVVEEGRADPVVEEGRADPVVEEGRAFPVVEEGRSPVTRPPAHLRPGRTPRRLVLLRHGRTAWNQQNRAQGHVDIPLDTVGHAQAAGAGPEIAKLHPVRLWASDLLRAQQTADYVARAAGLEIVTDPRLREFDLGERSGLTPTEFAARFPDEYADWGLVERPVPGEQTRAELAAQVVPALAEYVDALGPGETGVAVLHGAGAKVALAVLLGWPLDTFDTLRGLDNCRWAIFTERVRDSRLRLAAYNLSAPPQPARVQFASDGAVG